jgi:small subunit ribosomal protein S15
MRRHEKDTGSFEAQIAFLTERIINLSAYIQRNPADDIAKRGLYRYLSKRRRILSAMKQKEPQKYEEAVEMISSLAGMK